MKRDPLGPMASDQQVSLSLALLIGGAVFVLFAWLSAPRGTELRISRLVQFCEINALSLRIVGITGFLNILGLATGITQLMGLRRQGAKLSYLTARKLKLPFSFQVFLLMLLPLSVGSYFVSDRWLALHDFVLLPFTISPDQWTILSCLNLTITGSGLGFIALRVFKKINIFKLPSKQLPNLRKVRDGIVLGAINEHVKEKPSSTNSNAKQPTLESPPPSWVTMGLKALTGNIFIAGVIGSGKSQILLQFLRQILQNLDQRPALLAIDPKRTFVIELKRIVEKLGMQDHLIWVSLTGNVRFNPIWREKMLKDSSFTTVANTLKLASINFLGSSGDSRFWEQSSFNLLKGSLIYCAAKYDYFTFKELYRALVQARDEGLAGELVDCLSSKDWDDEEKANIEMAISYFKDEFSQMDEKIRTSILATATGFLNEFLEYRVSRILSPRREEITFVSIGQAIQEGKLICLNIENDAPARSIGTLFKLLYQEAVLERVTHPDHPSARYAVLVMDEFQDVVTSGGGSGLGDDRFLAKGREAKAITIAATQSVSSLENTIRSEPATRELLQNFRSRIFSNTTDPKTIRLFQEPHGQEEKERSSHSYSESSPDARRDVLFGGFDSSKSNISESISTHVTQEYLVTAREFSRLRAFEAFAQIFDGLETSFEKLYLKPYFLNDMRTSHQKIMKQMREASRVSISAHLLPFLFVMGGAFTATNASATFLFPNICSVVKTDQFRSCLDFSVGGCFCGWPVPRPCAKLTYNVPQTFIEVWPNSKDSFFSTIPGAFGQLKLAQSKNSIPFGIDDGQSSYSFQARAIPVPFAMVGLGGLSCGSIRLDKPCFDLMSEDLGNHWNTGSADSLQPQFLAWSVSPQACMLKGSASGLAGIEPTSSFGGDFGGCSYPLGFLPKYPPSVREACNGWGLFFPRSGVYEGGSRTIAALMVAARLKSIGIEVSHTIPGGPEETWQMIYPQSTSCFKEGTNPGVLEATKGLREDRRILGKPNGYLFVVWKKVSCCRDIPKVATSYTTLTVLSAICAAIPGGGI